MGARGQGRTGVDVPRAPIFSAVVSLCKMSVIRSSTPTVGSQNAIFPNDEARLRHGLTMSGTGPPFGIPETTPRNNASIAEF